MNFPEQSNIIIISIDKSCWATKQTFRFLRSSDCMTPAVIALYRWSWKCIVLDSRVITFNYTQWTIWTRHTDTCSQVPKKVKLRKFTFLPRYLWLWKAHSIDSRLDYRRWSLSTGFEFAHDSGRSGLRRNCNRSNFRFYLFSCVAPFLRRVSGNWSVPFL